MRTGGGWKHQTSEQGNLLASGQVDESVPPTRTHCGLAWTRKGTFRMITQKRKTPLHNCSQPAISLAARLRILSCYFDTTTELIYARARNCCTLRRGLLIRLFQRPINLQLALVKSGHNPWSQEGGRDTTFSLSFQD